MALRGLAFLPARQGPSVRAAVTIGGLRTIKNKGGGNRDRDDAFLEDNLNVPKVPAGRGSGSYERFIKAHKGTVINEEDKRKKKWDEWKERTEAVDLKEVIEDDEEHFLIRYGYGEREQGDDEGKKQRKGVMGAAAERGEGEADGRGERGQQSRGRRGARGKGKDEMEDMVPSYWDWDGEDIFIPRLPERTPDGKFMTSKILMDDNIQMRVDKLFWRRLLIQSKDLDKHVPSAWGRSKVLRASMEATRRQIEQGLIGHSGQAEWAHSDPEGKAEVERLNEAKTIEDIEKELGRLLVLGKFDLQYLQDSESEEDERGDGQEKETDDKEGEDGLSQRSMWADLHENILDETLKDEIPTFDPDEEGFEAFREYADQLIEAGGVIEYRSTMSDRYDREMDLPLPLATSRSLSKSLRKDHECHPKALRAPSAEGNGKIDDQAALAWLALAKNGNMGETDRLRMVDKIAETLRRFEQEEKGGGKKGPSPLGSKAPGKGAQQQQKKKAAATGGKK